MLRALVPLAIVILAGIVGATDAAQPDAPWLVVEPGADASDGGPFQVVTVAPEVGLRLSLPRAPR